MPDAVIIQIADAARARLAGAALSLDFVPERAYVPAHDLEDLDALKVTVVPAGLTLALLDRTPRHTHDYVIDIGVQKRIGVGPMTGAQIIAACDPLTAFTEEVLDLFRGRALPVAAGTAVCTAAANSPVFAPAHLDERRVFTSVLSLTFRMGR